MVGQLLNAPYFRSVLAYGGASLVTGIVAKILITKLFFDYPIVILMLQMATLLFTVEVLRVCGVVKLAPYTFDKGRHLFVPSTLMSVSSWLTISSYEGIALPLFDPVKRFTPLVIFLISTFIYRKQARLDKKTFVTVLAVCITSSFAVNFELTMGRFSLFYGLMACVLHALAFIQFENLSSTFSPLEMIYMHSFNSLVVFLAADIVQDEIRDAFMYVMTSSNKSFFFLFLVLMVLGIFLQYTTFHCIANGGALTTAVVANGRDAFQAIFSYYTAAYLYYDLYPGWTNWFSFLALGAALYSYFRSHDHDAVQKATPFAVKC